MMTRRRWLSLSLSALLLGAALGGCSKSDTSPVPTPPKAAPVVVTPPGARPIPVSKVPCFTGKILTPAQLSIQCIFAGMSPLELVVTESVSYAEVSSVWLASYQATFQARLFAEGVMVNLPAGKSGWDVSFDCIQFDLAFLTYSAEQYHRDTFYTASPASALAIIRIEYVRDTDLRYAASLKPPAAPEGHAILLIVTEMGPRFYDPQTGFVTLSTAEKASVFRKQAF